VEELEMQLVEKVTKEKRQIDLLMAKFHDGLASPTEKEQLRRLFVSKQQAQNERLINEQQRRIETLQARLLQQTDSPTVKMAATPDQAEIEALRAELADYKSLVYRLNLTAEEKDQALVIARVCTCLMSSLTGLQISQGCTF
jgi:Fe2+ transport system protein B